MNIVPRIGRHKGILIGMVFAFVLPLSSIGQLAAEAGAISTGGSSVSAIPTFNASTNQWQDWATSQRQAMESMTPAALATANCTVSNIVATPQVSNGNFGIPAGIVTDSLTVALNCNPVSTPSTGSFVAATTQSASTSCLNLTFCNTKNATNGIVTIGTGSYNGTAGYIGAAYTYTGSTSGYTAHTELGSPTSTCAVGTQVANSASQALTPGGSVEVLYGPVNFSANWSSTAWHYTGTAYQDLGTVCGSY